MEDALEGVAKAGGVAEAMPLRDLLQEEFAVFQIGRAMAEFGQATGVTATGLMLLRTVDPENRTPAAVSFGYKQLLQEPVMSGIWTALAFTLVFNIGWFKVWLISLFMLLVWGGVAVYINRVNARSHAAH